MLSSLKLRDRAVGKMPERAEVGIIVPILQAVKLQTFAAQRAN
jgi:hypothetical protein